MKRIQDIATFMTDGDWIESDNQSKSGIRLIQTGNIGTGKYLNKEARAKFISEETFENLKCTEIFGSSPISVGEKLASASPQAA